jgi:hypothetical protein
VGEVDKGCPGKWVQWGRGCKALPVGAFVEGELHLSWMQIFPSPCLLFFYFFILYFFFFKRLIRGHCPGVVTSGDSVTHKYFHRYEKVGS